ncbi:hypothetical protein [Salinibacillus xinjiangensis]|uniref:Glycosyltransferase RgtA/B/C/D-like domain-containing protein n=1 Tax=Salinibacillus xinjiangensis TaxID=1229268 RepID=A0A6G1X291_9BACI|nr:hypothetical protein [Salinibacillus xinjiangensis]MRG85062.1 hypothetical protein [Salinibacillus xinjiangensis]
MKLLKLPSFPYFDRKFIIVALFHWFFSFFTDRFIFTFSITNLPLSKLVLWCSIKGLSLILLLVMWQFISYIIKKRDRNTILFIKYSLIYFAIMLFFLLLTWPGVWRWDEFFVLEKATRLVVNPWQHSLTSILFMTALQIFPFPAGILLFQNIIMSMVVGYIVFKMSRFIDKKRYLYLVYVPFLSLAVLDSNLHPLRLSLYSYLELFFITFILFMRIDKRKWSIKLVIMSSFLISILATWRGESVYYVFLAPLVLILLFKSKLLNIHKLILVVTTFIMFSGLSSFQSYFIKDQKESDRYELTAIVEPLLPIVKEASLQDDPRLKDINQVINVELFMKHNRGIGAFWNEKELIRSNYTQEEFSTFKNTYYELVFSYLPVFFHERIDTFLATSAFFHDQLNTQRDTSKLYSFRGPPYDRFKQYSLNHPPYVDVREKTIKLLEGRDLSNYTKTTISYHVFYNVIPPLMAIFIIFIISLIKKRWTNCLLTILVLLKVPLVFAAAPDHWFMYYFPVYLIGYVFLTLFLVMFFYNKKYESKVDFFV